MEIIVDNKGRYMGKRPKTAEQVDKIKILPNRGRPADWIKPKTARQKPKERERFASKPAETLDDFVGFIFSPEIKCAKCKQQIQQELIEEIENHSAILDPQKGVNVGIPKIKES
jgi:hypothetical protein